MKRLALTFAGALMAAHSFAAQPGLDGIAGVAAAAKPGAGIAIAEITAPGSARTVTIGEGLGRKSSFRTASNTKTYTAATVMRLWEDGKIDLDASIRKYVDPAYIALLEGDGYDTAKITVRHLLSHTGGLADHAQTKQFLDTITNKPDTAWTRDSHMQALASWTDPVAAPGVKYSYSDSGYILLGGIVEKLTGQPLAQAVRTQLGFDRLGLSNTYWEIAEQPGAYAGQRAHQHLNGHDTYSWNASLDLYGGGGLVASPEDMARFVYMLLEGKVFKRPETLQAMLSKEGLPADSPYRLGIFEYDANGVKAYGHTGFWGTMAMYVPSQRRAIAFALTRQDTFKPTFEAVKAYVAASVR
ncbi:MAG TPA: serine hydrolase domain-containing protein [Telluria sp.]|nr:serine hydrolase domain-containing protein [Telluria sp.]